MVKDGRILLMRRFQTGYCDGQYGLPSGHLEPDETLAKAVCREAAEEVGIEADEEGLDLVGMMHRKSEDGGRLDVAFAAGSWRGEPVNQEPQKCDHLDWFPLTALPENMVPEVRVLIQNYQNGTIYAEYGWE